MLHIRIIYLFIPDRCCTHMSRIHDRLVREKEQLLLNRTDQIRSTARREIRSSHGAAEQRVHKEKALAGELSVAGTVSV